MPHDHNPAALALLIASGPCNMHENEEKNDRINFLGSSHFELLPNRSPKFYQVQETLVLNLLMASYLGTRRKGHHETATLSQTLVFIPTLTLNLQS